MGEIMTGIRARFLAVGIFAAAMATASTSGAVTTFEACTGTGFDISNNVTEVGGTASITSDCSFTFDENQDFLNTNPITVNIDPGFFGITDWEFEGKIGVNDGGFDLSNAGDADGNSGSFDLSGLGLTGQIMLIFKSGNGTGLVGYLLEELAGEWESPFLNPPFSFNGGNPKSVSHISVYTSGVAAVPLPAAGWLLLAGLGGLGLVARRRRAQA